MSLTISNKNDSRLSRTFNLDDSQVNAAEIGTDSDAGVLLKILVLKMLQPKMKDFGNFRIKSVKRDFRVLTSLTQEDFENAEDFEKYEEYMKKLIKKALGLPVASTVEKLEDNLKGKKGSALFEIFGEKKKDSILENIIDKKVTFEQLLLPAYLGQSYEGIAGKPSKIMDVADKGGSLYDYTKLKPYIKVDDKEGKKGADIFVRISWDLKAFLMSLLKEEGWLRLGMSLVDITQIDDVGGHLRVIPNKKEESDAINVKLGNRMLTGKDELKLGVKTSMQQSRELQDKLSGRMQTVSEEKVAGFEIYDGGSTPIEEQDASPEGRRAMMKYIEDMLDVDDKMKERMSEILIKGSNFLKPKRTKNIATKGRGGRVGGTDREPTVSELTRNYLDLDIGTMHFEVSLKAKVEQLVEQQTETKKEEMDIFDYTVELEKEGELRLAEEGAFIIADRDKVEGISDILKGIKTFMGKTRKLRS